MEQRKNYKEKLTRFFEKYSEKRREWQLTLNQWKEADKKPLLRAQIEALMAQIEDYHNALGEMLAQEKPDFSRVRRMQKQMHKCYKELAHIIKPVWRQWLEAIVVTAIAAFFLRTYVFGLYHVPTGSAEPTLLVGDRIFGNKFTYFLREPKHGDYIILDDPEFVYDSSPVQRLWQKYVGFPILGILKAGPMNWTKRVLAVPGDTIEGRMENGRTALYLNGKKLEEKYVNPHPLLYLRKKVGFFDPHSGIGSLLPSFLHSYDKPVRYTYDESASYEEQPYYHMRAEEVIRDARTGEPYLYPSGSPSRNAMGRNVDVFGPIRLPEDKYWVQGDSRLNSRDSRYWGFLDRKFIQGRASCILFSLDSEEPFWLFALLKNPWHFFTRAIRWNRFARGLHAIPDWRLTKGEDKTNE